MKWDEIEITKLSDRLTKGTTPTTVGGQFVESGTNFIKVECINDDGQYLKEKFSYIDDRSNDLLKRSIIYEDDILISIAGAIGRTAYVKEDILPANTNQALAIIRPNKTLVYNKFLYYSIRSPSVQGKLKGSVVQAAQPNISLGMLGSIKVLLPPLPTQRKIASILSAYDDLIENNLKRIKLLEEKAFLSYKQILIEETDVIEFSIEEICDTVGGGTPSTGNRQFWDDGEIIWFVPTDLTKHHSLVLLDSEKKITQLGLEKSSAKLVPPKSILMTSRATIGYFGIINKTVCTNQGFINIIPFKDHYRTYLLFNLKERKDEIINNANGSTYLEITKGNFRRMKINVPRNEECLINLENEFQLIFNLIENLLIQNTKLREARDILLPRLMNGEIEV